MHRSCCAQISSPIISRLIVGAVACALYSGASAVGAWEIPEPKPSASFSDTHRIEDQPGVYRQVLNNGMELVVIADDSKVPNTSADDEQAMQLWLIVRAGSLYETPDQRGAARVLEEIIRMGTRTASDEHISDLLLNDVSWDTDLPGSFVGFDQAAFIARVDQNDPATMTQLIEFFTSLLDGNSLVLSDERIKQAIERVIEKISNEQDPEQRSRRRWLPRLMAKTPFGDRIPSPTIETLTRLTPESVRTFARQTYHPAQATLVALGVGDLSQVRSQLETQCSSIPDVGPSRMADGRNHLDSAMRSVLDVDPGFTESQAAMIWFHDRPMPTSTPETWYQRARSFAPSEIRSTVIDRIAGEVIRYRLGRLVSQELGMKAKLDLDQFDLWGQVDLMQAVVSGDGLDWASAMRTIVGESDRLARQGVSTEEIKRARRSVLSRYHRDAQAWESQGIDRRIGMYHWLITTGRPIIGMARWDALATEMLTQITDQQIREAIESLADPRQATFVALMPTPPSSDPKPELAADALVKQVALDALADPLDPLDPAWFQWSVGSLLDTDPADRNAAAQDPSTPLVKEITQHPESGVWRATLDNGIVLWAKSDPAPSDHQDANAAAEVPDHRLSITATISGAPIDQLVGQDLLGSAAISAWNTPATENRSSAAVGAYINEYGIDIHANQTIGAVQIQIDAPCESEPQAIELLYALLRRPMIEQETFDRWQSQHLDQPPNLIETGLKKLYRQSQSQDHHRAPDDPKSITLDDAQRVLSRICQVGEIDIAMVGVGDEALDAPSMIEHAARYFARLHRSPLGHLDFAQQPNASSPHPLGSSKSVVDPEFEERTVTIGSPAPQDQGLVVGYLTPSGQDLVGTRTLVLASMTLDRSFNAMVEHLDLDATISVQIVFTDLVDARAILMVRARCDQDQIETIREVINTAIDTLLIEGINEQVFNTVHDALVASIDQYTRYPQFWSQRLSALRANDRSLNDLWGMKQGYAEITPAQANAALHDLLLSGDRFTMTITADD